MNSKMEKPDTAIRALRYDAYLKELEKLHAEGKLSSFAIACFKGAIDPHAEPNFAHALLALAMATMN